MKIVLLLLVFGFIFVGIPLIIRFGLNRGINAVDRAISHNSIDEGNVLVSQVYTFETSVSIADALQAVENYIPVSETIPVAFTGALYLIGKNDHALVWGFGNKAGGSMFKSQLVFREAEGKVTGSFCFTSYVTKNQKLCSIDAMKQLLSQVRQAFLQLDPSVKMANHNRKNSSGEK